jgi:hypothetical protein
MSTAYILGAEGDLAGIDLGTVFATATQARQSLAARQSAQPGFLSRLLGGIGKVGTWFDHNAQNIVQVTDAVGRLRNKARSDGAAVEAAWDRNIRHEAPRPSWFSQELIPGVSNGLLVGVGVGLVGLFFVMKKKGGAS